MKRSRCFGVGTCWQRSWKLDLPFFASAFWNFVHGAYSSIIVPHDFPPEPHSQFDFRSWECVRPACRILVFSLATFWGLQNKCDDASEEASNDDSDHHHHHHDKYDDYYNHENQCIRLMSSRHEEFWNSLRDSEIAGHERRGLGDI
jgi:hypothetical protein